MAPPPSKPPVKQGNVQKGGDMDEKKRMELTAMQGMMNDLGMARQEELPLDNSHRESDRDRKRGVGQGGRGRGKHDGDGFGFGGHGNYTWGNHGFGDAGQRIFGQGPDPRGRAPKPPAQRDMGLAEVWANAIGSGVFEDDDAAAVQGLDDLGGGRLHAGGGRPFAGDAKHHVHGAARAMGNAASQKAKAMDQTLKILQYGNKRSHQPISNPTPTPQPRQQEVRNNASRRNCAPAAGHSQPRSGPPSQQSQARVIQPSVPPTNIHLQPVQTSGPAKPARVLSSQALRAADNAMDAMEAGEKLNKLLQQEACGMPENTVFKAPIRFLSRDINPPMPAFVFLSSGEPPQLGLFSIVICGHMFCQWPVSAWIDYSEGESNSLSARFTSGPNGAVQCYDLYFHTRDVLRDFETELNALRSGNHLGTPECLLTPTQGTTVSGTPVLTPIQKAVAKPKPTKTQEPRDTLSLANPTNGSPNNSASIRGEAVTSPNDASNVIVSPIARDNLATTANGAGQDKTPPQTVAQTVAQPRNDHPSISKPEVVNTAFSHPASVAPEVLSPLDLDNANDSAITDAGSSTATLPFSQEQVITLCRHLINVFYQSSGVQKPLAEWDEMVAGIKSGVLAFVMQDARLQGYSTEQLQELEALVHRALSYNPVASARATDGRTQYTAEELLSMRHAAVNPPSGFADVVMQHLAPQRSQHPSTSAKGSRAKMSREASSSFESQFSASANAMRWVLELEEPPKSEESPAQSAAQSTAQSAAPSVVSSDATGPVGLGNSRWASEGEEIKHANCFTGLRYEKAWPKRSYLNDLALLDPQATVAVGAEDLMDYYFPPFHPENTGAQPKVNSNDAVDAVPDAEPESGTAPTADNIENLRVGISRLSLSPRAAPFVPAQSVPSVQSLGTASTQVPRQVPADSAPAPSAQPIEPPAPRSGLQGLGASRHSDGNSPSSSGQFNFYKPRGG